jgi:hypothetical protein
MAETPPNLPVYQKPSHFVKAELPESLLKSNARRAPSKPISKGRVSANKKVH